MLPPKYAALAANAGDQQATENKKPMSRFRQWPQVRFFGNGTLEQDHA
jgi:hypothetical protein